MCLWVCSNAYAGSRVLPPVVDNSIYPAGIEVSSSASANVIYEVLGRLEQLQLEVQQLRGMVEEQSQTIVDLKKRQGNIYSDLDLRLQEVAKANAMLQSGEVIANPSISPSRVKNDTAPVEVIAAEPVITEKTRYHEAYQLLRNGHNKRAITAFNVLINDYPQGEYADNAQYWIGEAYKANQDLESAKKEFLKVVMQYAGSPKVPDALLKLGYIEFEQNNIAQARDYLTQVTVGHPETTAAHLATKKLMQMTEMQR